MKSFEQAGSPDLRNYTQTAINLKEIHRRGKTQ
jgi:hypothetical protein